jgi:hypothetical protein
VHSIVAASGTRHTGQRCTGAPGLGVTDDVLAALIAACRPLGAPAEAPNEADRGFLLTEANLTLYQHARLSHCHDVRRRPVRADRPCRAATGHIDGMAVYRPCRRHAWWQGSG